MSPCGCVGPGKETAGRHFTLMTLLGSLSHDVKTLVAYQRWGKKLARNPS